MSSVWLDIIKIAVQSLIGAVIGPLVARLVAQLRRPSDGGNNTVPARRKPRGFWRYLVVPAVIGAIVLGVLGYVSVKPTPPFPCPWLASPNALIISPADRSVVPQLTIVQGTACHIPQDRELWLLVAAAGVPGYYPQNGPIIVSSDRKWSASAQLGQAGSVDVGRGFVLYTALADQGGRAAILSYFASAPNFTPLNPLPAGIQLLDQIAIVRE